MTAKPGDSGSVLIVQGVPADHAFGEIAAACDLMIAQGRDIYQKFTCRGCGQRLTMEEPNRLYTHGTCDKCGAVTDIERQGCNYRLVQASDPSMLSPNRSLTIVTTNPARVHPKAGSA